MMYDPETKVKGIEVDASIARMHAEMIHNVSALTSLAMILHWIEVEGLAHASLELIAQDEYSHDLLLPWKEFWLVFGLT